MNDDEWLAGLIPRLKKENADNSAQSDSDFVNLLREAIIIDRRDIIKDKIKKGKLKKNDRIKGSVLAANIDALVLHQISFDRGNSQEKYDEVGVHFIITPDGSILQLYDESNYLWCSNKFNKRSVGVEFVGNFPDENGKWWKGVRARNIPSQKQVYSGRKLINYLRLSLNIRYVFTHRQTNNNKSNCPGPHIWYNLGEWALKNGFSDGGTGFTLGNGKRIPEQWRDKSFDLLNADRLLTPYLTREQD